MHCIVCCIISPPCIKIWSKVLLADGLLYVTWSAKLTICCEIEEFKLANKFFKTFLLFYFLFCKNCEGGYYFCKQCNFYRLMISGVTICFNCTRFIHSITDIITQNRSTFISDSNRICIQR